LFIHERFHLRLVKLERGNGYGLFGGQYGLDLIEERSDFFE
jgi:hypothetical protein